MVLDSVYKTMGMKTLLSAIWEKGLLIGDMSRWGRILNSMLNDNFSMSRLSGYLDGIERV